MFGTTLWPFAFESFAVNSIKLPERMIALLIMNNLLPVLHKTNFTLDKAQFLDALLKNHCIDLESCIIDLITSIKLSKSQKLALPYGGMISKVLTHFSDFPCASDHLAPQFGPCYQITLAKSESLKRKRSASSVNTPSSSTTAPPFPIPLPSDVLSCLEKMFEDTREIVLIQVRDLKKEAAKLKGSMSKIEMALTTLLKRTNDSITERNEAETQVEGDAAQENAELEDDVPTGKGSTFGMVHLEFLDFENEYLFRDSQNPQGNAAAPSHLVDPVLPTDLVDPTDPRDDDDDSLESQ